MGLLHKVRILVGALAHMPFTSRPEKADLGDESPKQGKAAGQSGPALQVGKEAALDTDRVADLITEREQTGES